MTVEEMLADLSGVDRWGARAAFARYNYRGPRYLYKYHGPTAKAIKSTIEDSELWMASPASFNDPFDTRARITLEGTEEQKVHLYARLMTKRGFSTSEALARAVTAARSGASPSTDVLHEYINGWGITCFASSRQLDGHEFHAARSLLMWSHYGVSHTGICFQFHAMDSPETFVQTLPIEYNDRYITINWAERDKVEPLLSQMLTRKAIAWSYERERRIVIPYRANTTLPFRPSALRGVILGVKASQETIVRVVEHIRTRIAAGGPPVRIYRACPKTGFYRLEVQRDRSLEEAAART